MSPTDLPQAIGVPSLGLGDDLIVTVVDLLETGWSSVLARKRVTSKSTEPEIAGILGREVLNEKKRRGIGNLRIEEEVGTRSSPSAVKPEGRIDIKVIYSFDEDEYFGVECKRVSGRKSDGLAREYVENGVMRFVMGKYSPGHRWAAMVGFVVDGRTLDCVRLIEQEVAARAAEVRLRGAWGQETLFGASQHLYRTRHEQSRQVSISILHLFLALN